jgi:hypothetical protein
LTTPQLSPNRPQSRPWLLRAAAPLIAASFVWAGCGRDQADTDPAASDEEAEKSAAERPSSATAESSEEDSLAPLPEVGEVPGAEASLFSDELHDIELPEAGTAIAIIDGERFEASVIDNCQVQQQIAGQAFEIGTTVPAPDNGEIYMSARRTVTPPDRAAEMGTHHEAEGFTVILSLDESLEWQASRSFNRSGPDDPVREDAPVVRVVEQGEGYAVTVNNHAMLTDRRFRDAGAVSVMFAAVCE